MKAALLLEAGRPSCILGGAMKPIEPDKTYWLCVDDHRFKVRTVRASALAGWWICDGEQFGDRIIVPEKLLVEVDENEPR
jgi:hypothetical protein